jgi:hypothetical protein
VEVEQVEFLLLQLDQKQVEQEIHHQLVHLKVFAGGDVKQGPGYGGTAGGGGGSGATGNPGSTGPTNAGVGGIGCRCKFNI